MKAQFTLEFSFFRYNLTDIQGVQEPMASNTITRLLSVTMYTYIIFDCIGANDAILKRWCVCVAGTRREKTVSVIN